MNNHQIAPAPAGTTRFIPVEKVTGPSINRLPARLHCRAHSNKMLIKPWLAVILCLVMVSVSSCKKDVIAMALPVTSPSAVDSDVYVAGYNNGNIVYWKNGVEQALCASAWSTGEALGIAVSGNDVYVVGKRNNNAVYWKNGLK